MVPYFKQKCLKRVFFASLKIKGIFFYSVALKTTHFFLVHFLEKWEGKPYKEFWSEFPSLPILCSDCEFDLGLQLANTPRIAIMQLNVGLEAFVNYFRADKKKSRKWCQAPKQGPVSWVRIELVSTAIYSNIDFVDKIAIWWMLVANQANKNKRPKRHDFFSTFLVECHLK